MTNFGKKAGLTIALAATALAASAPADAQRYRGYRHYDRGGNAAGAAIVGGIIGLGVGAAIASSNRPVYRGGGYGSYGGYGGYNRGYGYPAPAYNYPRGGYGYGNGYGYAPPPVRRCWTEQRFDPYYGYAVPVQVCG